MNSLELRAILDWWMVSDPWPESVPKGIVDTWLQGECQRQGYENIIQAYHRHEAEGNEPAAKPLICSHGREPGKCTATTDTCDACPNTPWKWRKPAALSDSALSRLGQAMLADYVDAGYTPSRAEIAMRAMQGIIAHAHNDVSYEGAVRDAVVYADELLAELAKVPRT